MKREYITPDFELIVLKLTSDILETSYENGGAQAGGDFPGDDSSFDDISL